MTTNTGNSLKQRPLPENQMVSKVVNSSLRDFVSTQKSGSPAKKDSQVRTHCGRRESDTGPRGSSQAPKVVRFCTEKGS